MPRPRRHEYDSAEFSRRYHSDETLESLADWLGVGVTAIYKAARVRGFPMKFEMRAQK